METINRSIKEWNAIVEALGQGKQSIIIRNYNPAHEDFLLYPTWSYSRRDGYLSKFKQESREFVEKNALPKKVGEKTEIKYCAKVIKVIPTSINKINKYHIWDNNHVKEYIKQKKAKTWVLRVYRLKKPYIAEKNPAMIYANLKNGINIEDATPVLTDLKFKGIIESL